MLFIKNVIYKKCIYKKCIYKKMLQVHNNESTECPDCGKALTISNLNKHIKSVHKKMKKTCEICNEEVPYSSISVHKRKVHGIGKSMDDITPRGPNLKLRKRYRCGKKQY